MKKLIYNNLRMMKYIVEFCPSQIPIVIFESIIKSIQAIMGTLLLKYTMDAIGLYNSFDKVIFIIIFFLIINIGLSLITTWIDQDIIPVNFQTITGKMQLLLFDKANSLDLDCYENTTYYNKFLIAREQAESRILGVLNSFSTLISSFFCIGAFTILIATSEPILIFISIINVGISFLMNTMSVKIQSVFYKQKVSIEREMNYIQRVTSESQYAKEIRMYGKFSDLLKNRFNNRLQELIFLIRKYSWKYIKITSLQNIVSQILNATVILYLGYRAVVKLISSGSFVSLVNCSQQLTNQLSSLIKVLPEIYEHGIYIESFLEFMNLQPKIKSGERLIRSLENGDIEFKHVSFRYSNTDKNALEDVNFRIKYGEKVAIVGRNGSGKSTVVKLLNRLYEPKSGEIYIQGYNYKEFSLDSIRNYIGTLFQDFQMFSISIAENILMCNIGEKEEYEDRVKKDLQFVGLRAKVENMKKGVFTEITKEFDDEGVIFSGGEYQKIAIARVFEKNSGVMVFDEPSSALDPISEKELFDKMLELGKNKTVIFVSHRLSNVTNVDKILYFEGGRLKESGTHSELMKMNGLYSKMYQLQAERYL